METLPSFKNDAGISISLQRAQMRSLKVFWCVASIMKRSKSLGKMLEKTLEKDILINPGLLNMAFKTVTGWTEIYLKNLVAKDDKSYTPNPPLITTVFVSTLILSLAQDSNPSLFYNTFREEIIYQLKGFLRQVRYPTTKFPSSTCLMEEFTFRLIALVSQFFSSRWTLDKIEN
jgi:hypothetical protein